MTVSQNYLTQWHSVPELSHPMTQRPITVSPNDTVSQDYLTQWHSVPELSHPMTECHTVPISPSDSVPELSHPITQYHTALNYLTQWHSVLELSQPMTQCPRTISPNDTVSQNCLTQWQSVTLFQSHPMTQCSRTISSNDTVSHCPELSHQWHSVPELSHPMTQCPRTISPNDMVSHYPRTPESLDNSTSEKTAIPISKQQTPVYKTVWHRSPKDCNFNAKFWSLTSVLFVLTWNWHCQFAITNLPVWRLVGAYFDKLLSLS
jgi:hypothetical protein